MREWMVNSAASLLELSSILLCYKYIMQAPLTNDKRKICLAYVGMLVMCLLELGSYINSESNLVDMLYCSLMPLIVMKKDKIKWILLYPCTFMLSSLVSVTVSFVVALGMGIPQGTMVGNDSLAFLINAIFPLIICMVILFRNTCVIKQEYVFHWNNSLYVATTIGAVIFYLLIGFVQGFGAYYEMQHRMINILGLLLSLAAIVVFTCFLWLSATIYKNESIRNEKNMLNWYLAEQKKSIQLMLEKDIDMRKFRHDIREHMYIISHCIQKKKYNELETYVQSMNEEFDNAQQKRYTGITTIDVILSDKEHRMAQRDILFQQEINILKLPEGLEEYDICTILINLLNNAMEACENLSSGDKRILLRVEIIGSKLCMLVKNKYKHNIQFDKEHNPISTKQSANHGLGSKNIRRVVEKYDGELNYSVGNNEFCVEIFL